jgi:DNA-binding CsgD family transcriptional regulator
MSNHLSLVRKAQTIITYLNNHVSKGPGSDVTQVFSMMRDMQNIFPQWVLLACPVMHPRISFITDNCKNILGFTAEYFSEASAASLIFSRTHDDDLQDLYHCYSFIESFLKETMPYEYPNLRFVLQYRFYHSDGHYITLHDEKAMLLLNESEPLYYSIIKDISQEVVFTGVKLEIFKQDPILKKIAEYNPGRERIRLSKREQEIVELMQTGLSTKEIAHKLRISQHTARNIKQKMFQKYKVNNAITLLNKAVYHQ